MKKKYFQELLKSINSCKVICVTGQMASGKNYICSQLEKDGWKSIDADLLVHHVIKTHSHQIYTTFRNEAEENNINILEKSITENEIIINRRALGKLLFSNPSLLKKQENIVYPEITKLIEEFIRENTKTIINATVLYKTPELLQKCDITIFVKANFLKRIMRAKKRDHLPFSQIMKRFMSQKNLYKEYTLLSKKIITISN